CISVNDEAVHGIPGSRRIAAGDLVKLDVTAELRGYMADAAVTVPVPPVAAEDAEVERRGFRVLRELAGHGIGRAIHEPPSVPNFGVAGQGARLTDGLVITIEPIISTRTRSTRPAGDGWTVTTDDGGRSAHVEHSIIVRRGRPLILTA